MFWCIIRTYCFGREEYFLSCLQCCFQLKTENPISNVWILMLSGSE